MQRASRPNCHQAWTPKSIMATHLWRRLHWLFSDLTPVPWHALTYTHKKVTKPSKASMCLSQAPSHPSLLSSNIICSHAKLETPQGTETTLNWINVLSFLYNQYNATEVHTSVLPTKENESHWQNSMIYERNNNLGAVVLKPACI